jgi:hypothetical protein
MARGYSKGPEQEMGASPPEIVRGADRKKKKKKVKFKKTLPRGGTQGYSSSYSDPLTKRKVVDLGSSM